MPDAVNPYDTSAVDSLRDCIGVQSEPRTHTRWLLTLATLLLIPVVTLYFIARPAFDRTLLSRIAPGMTRAQVSAILGPPNDTEGPSQWEYWRYGNAGWVEIAFDDTDVVLWVNDESVFP